MATLVNDPLIVVPPAYVRASRLTIPHRWVLAYGCVGIILAAVGLWLGTPLRTWSDALPAVALANGALTLGAVWAMRRGLGFRWASVPMAYFYYFAIAHVAYLVIWVVDRQAATANYNYSTLGWLDTPGALIAAFAVTLAIPSMLLGISLGVGGASSRPHAAAPGVLRAQPGLFWGGFILSALALGLLVRALLHGGGLATLYASYSVHREDMLGWEYDWGQFLIGLGGGFTLAGATRKSWFWGLIPFWITAVIFVITGNRGGVFYPLLSYLVILDRRGVRFSRKQVLVTLAMIWVIIPTVFQLRGLQKNEWSAQALTIGWADPLVEMGLTVRTIAYTNALVSAGDYQFVHGGSYWLPVERQLAYAMPFAFDRTFDPADARIPKRKLRGKGYSPVAEAYFNFGLLGPLLVFPILGFILARLDRLGWGAHYQLGVVVLVLFPLIDNIRNAFISVPGRVLAGFMVLGAIFVWDSVIRRTVVRVAR